VVCMYENLSPVYKIALYLVLTNLESCSVQVSFDTLSNVDPYHPPLAIDLNAGGMKQLSYNTMSQRPNFAKADYDKIRADLSQINWTEIFSLTNDVNKMVEIFYNVIEDLISTYVPRKKVQNINRFPPWFGSSLIHRLKEKNKTRIRYKRYKNPLDRLGLKLLTKRCNKLATECYNNYIKNIEERIACDAKSFFSFIKSKRGGSSSHPSSMTDGKNTATDGPSVCNLLARRFSQVYNAPLSVEDKYSPKSSNPNSINFNQLPISTKSVSDALKKLNPAKGIGSDGVPPQFFKKCAIDLVVPLCHIYNTSLQTGVFPDRWKLAKVVPILKSGDCHLVENYRPISVLPSASQMFESIVNPYITEHIKALISHNQHGFMKSRSTATNLVTFVEDLSEAVDARLEVDVIYTDLSKAFDRVPHNLLFKKLYNFGIIGNILNFFKSYLENRKFYVVINGFNSEVYSISSGVPQGSIFGPVLFNIFINDVIEDLLFSTPYIYADDLKISKIIRSEVDVRLLQLDLNNLMSWCEKNGMELNVKKCFHIKFSRKQNTLRSKYTIGGTVVDEVTSIRDLGVILDKKLTFQEHIEHIMKKASKMLGFVIRNTREFRILRTKRLLYNAFVLSLLEYCSVVWRPHYACHCLRIERVQKRYLWHLAYSAGKCRKGFSYRARLKYFKYDSLDDRRNLNDLVFLHKLLNNKLDCPQLLQKFNFRVPMRMPRNQVEPLLPPRRSTVLGSSSTVPILSRLLNCFGKSSDIHSVSLNAFRKHMLESIGAG
jgi:hypothetical protein